MKKQKFSTRDFTIFKRCFKMYQERFGLNGYNVYFRLEPLKESFAAITVKHEDMVALVRLNSKVDPDNVDFANARVSAKHEALHLLIMRLEHRARCRYLSEEEIYEAAEELVFKLEELIE